MSRQVTRYHSPFYKAAAIIMIAFTSLAGMQIAYADDYDDAVKKAKNNEQVASSRVADIESKLANAEATAQSYQEKAMMADLAYNNAMSELVLARQDLAVAQKNATEAKAKLEKARKSLGTLARTLYTSQGSLNSVTIYLSGDGFETVAMKKVAVELFGAKAEAKIKNFANLKKVTDTIVAKADKQEKQTQQLVATVAADKAKVEASQREANQQVTVFNVQKEKFVAELASARGTTIKAEKQRQAKRAEERRAKEAAEKRKIQAELERNAKKNSSTSTSNTNGKPQPAAKPKKPNPPKPSVSNGNGSLRNQIVAYANTFIGVPYVWGGTTPRGFDCSGLMLYVYRHFGIKLPRLSQQQRYAGKVISKSEAQPGDMVNWYTHVGLYIGNGYMIHAPRPGRHVEISRVWGNPTYVRVL